MTCNFRCFFFLASMFVSPMSDTLNLMPDVKYGTMRPFDWAPGVIALPIVLIKAFLFVGLVFYFFVFVFCFLIVCCLLSYVVYTSLWLNKLIDTCLIRIARKGHDLCCLINEVFMQRPLRRLWNLIYLLFLYILFGLVEIRWHRVKYGRILD